MKKERCKTKDKSMLRNVQWMKESHSHLSKVSNHKGETPSSGCHLPSPFVCACV